MTFSPITRSFFQRICFRFRSIFIKLQRKTKLLSLFVFWWKGQPEWFLEWPHRVHRILPHVVFPYRIFFAVVFEQISYKSVDVYAKKDNQIPMSILSSIDYQRFDIKASSTIGTRIGLNISIDWNGLIISYFIRTIGKDILLWAIHITIDIHYVAWHGTQYV